MLQIDMRHFASDALEDAMRLAQTKALNSYTFSDCLSFLNYAWRDIYDRVAAIDDGYYGVNVKLTKKLTTLPPFVKNSLMVYSAQTPIGYDRRAYRSANFEEITSACTYRISGRDLYCEDVGRRPVWLYYVPVCGQLFFTHHNRDPKLYENSVDGEQTVHWGHGTVRSNVYNLFILHGYIHYDDEGAVDVEVDFTLPNTTAAQIKEINKWTMEHRGTGNVEDVTDMFAVPVDDDDDGNWQLCYVSCDYPYIFLTYEHSITGEHISGFLDAGRQFNAYNPFDFTGRNSNVEYIDCRWNDKTGMGVFIKDWNDLDENNLPRIKELGWTPDSLLDYPATEMYRYLVARLADKLAALNESDVMGVKKELIEAQYAFEAFLDKDKASWKRITNVNPPSIADYL